MNKKSGRLSTLEIEIDGKVFVFFFKLADAIKTKEQHLRIDELRGDGNDVIEIDLPIVAYPM